MVVNDPQSPWLDLAGKASRWTLQTAKDASVKGLEAAQAEIERQKTLAANRSTEASKPVEETDLYKKFWTKILDENLVTLEHGIVSLKSDADLIAYCDSHCKSKIFANNFVLELRAANRFAPGMNENTQTFVQKFPERAWAAFRTLRPEAIENGERIKAELKEKEAQAKLEKLRLEAIPKEEWWRKFYNDPMSIAYIESPLLEDETTRHVAGGETQKIQFKAKFRVSRLLSSMKTHEIFALKYTSLLTVHGLLSNFEEAQITWSILYNNGNCSFDFPVMELRRAYCEDHGIRFGDNVDAVRVKLSQLWGVTTPEAGMSRLLSTFATIGREHPEHHVVKEFRSMLLGGNGWLSEQTLATSPLTTTPSPYALFIGDLESGDSAWFNGEGSIITIAPPGSGKTQCHVFPNLLTYGGPTIVLDVKGECFNETSAYRQEYFGPVYKFNPLNPADSARYNPLSFIENDPDTLWEDCRLLADLLIVPENRQDSSWENRGRDVVTGVIAWLVRSQAPEDRRMGRIVDIVSKIDWERFVSEAKYVLEVPPLSRLGNALAVMPERQLEGVLDAARRHLSVWEGSRVERVTSASDWTPDVLRDGSNSTIYICIPPNEIESYAPLLRVIFAQHLRQLLRKLPERGDQAPILFMLDELPRLGQMRPVEEALEVGRQYGIRLWMFAQSLGQLDRAYANAEGMVGSCGIRIYMNPSAHDGTAKRLSEELGEVESVIDSSRQPMVEAYELAGPKYADLQIVLCRNSYPAKLKKVFAHSEPGLRERLEENRKLATKA